MQGNIVHLTSVHSRNDARIFAKMCTSASANNYNVTLIVADGKGTDNKNGVNIIDVGRLHGRFNRILKTTFKLYRACVVQNADAYHIHDPELLPVGLVLKSSGKIVIFDMHENVAAQIYNKKWIPYIFRPAISLCYKLFQYVALRFYDAVILAETCYEKININCKYVATVRNYPIVEEFEMGTVISRDEKKYVSYVGGISLLRGLQQMVDIAPLVRCEILLAGPPVVSDLEKVKENENWPLIRYLGVIAREDVASVLSSSFAGLVVLHPIENYKETEPTKMFEYMASGIPVIASNFPSWKGIVESIKCGICVDPLDTHAIADAIDYLLDNPEVAKRMGENGRQAVLQKYNWSIEEKKLLCLYEKTLRL
ncbi:glycosyl transferase [Geothermobacter hydrogeniphilus]|uniref:Glycosyl transferase n=1 Tax=Geothermobacter hydrogeniphilus TaxID=1969733 RepID=A0A2K2H607_9BACT|nr:glycosyltransferase [Geothermobacter hydrogeniphilus]PNU18670.1 glycosyl transferase [Geothermobacter hydrogeniphilus]